MKMTAVVTIAILYRGGVSGTCPCPLGFLNVNGVNQNSIPVSFSIFPSSSVSFLPSLIHLFLSSEFSHFNSFELYSLCSPFIQKKEKRKKDGCVKILYSIGLLLFSSVSDVVKPNIGRPMKQFSVFALPNDIFNNSPFIRLTIKVA